MGAGRCGRTHPPRRRRRGDRMCHGRLLARGAHVGTQTPRRRFAVGRSARPGAGRRRGPRRRLAFAVHPSPGQELRVCRGWRDRLPRHRPDSRRLGDPVGPTGSVAALVGPLVRRAHHAGGRVVLYGSLGPASGDLPGARVAGHLRRRRGRRRPGGLHPGRPAGAKAAPIGQSRRPPRLADRGPPRTGDRRVTGVGDRRAGGRVALAARTAARIRDGDGRVRSRRSPGRPVRARLVAGGTAERGHAVPVLSREPVAGHDAPRGRDPQRPQRVPRLPRSAVRP